MMNVAILGSGKGTTARSIIEASLKKEALYTVKVILSTREGAGICSVGTEYHCAVVIVDAANPDFSEKVVACLKQYNVDLLVLAGFMKILPADVIIYMKGQVINIHPALLPKFGGKGMFGRRVHAAVKNSGEKETGATVHWVTAEYDAGAIISQVTVPVLDNDGEQEIEAKVRQAERRLYPMVIETLAQQFQPHDKELS